MGERSIAADVDELVSIAYVARLAKWNRGRMWRRLKKLDASNGGGLLQNLSDGAKPRYVVGLRALRQAWPGLFSDDLERLNERVSTLEERVDDLTRVDETLAREVGAARQEMRHVKKKVEQLRLVS